MTLKSTRLYIALFFLLCIASIFILYHPKKQPAATQPQTIDSFIYQAQLTEYNKQGKMKSDITAANVIHYKESDITFLVAPRILVYSDQNIPWKIHADQAKMMQSNTIIVLSGHVIIHQLQTLNHPETIIKTTTLTVYPKESRAETTAPVTINRRGMAIVGKGLTANLKTGQYQLTSETKAILQPSLLHKTN